MKLFWSLMSVKELRDGLASSKFSVTTAAYQLSLSFPLVVSSSVLESRPWFLGP